MYTDNNHIPIIRQIEAYYKEHGKMPTKSDVYQYAYAIDK